MTRRRARVCSGAGGAGCRTAPRTGFTLVELLVVMAVVSVLVGVLAPTLAGVRRRAVEVRDSAAMGQVLLGYRVHANEHDDRLIVGYLDHDPTGAVDDGFGGMVQGQPRRRWPWRLVSYLDMGLRGTLLTGSQEKLLDNVPPADNRFAWHYAISTSPSFGLNGHVLGGYEGTTPPFRVRTHMAQVRRPSDVVAFGSSRSESFELGTVGVAEGWYLIEPPTWGQSYLSGGEATWPPALFAPDSHPELYGNLDARYRERVLTGHVDGHAGFRTVEQMRDLSVWGAD